MPIDDSLEGREFESQFADGKDPDDSDTPGATNDGTLALDGEEGETAAAPAPAAAPAEAPAAAPAPAEASAAAPGGAPAEQPEEYVPEARRPMREAPEDAEEQLAAADTKRAEAFQKYDDGHITREEFEAIDKETRKVEREINAQQARDAAREAVAQEAVMTLWDSKRTAAINELVKAGIKPEPDTIAEFDKVTGAFGDIAATRKMTDGPQLKASQWALDQAVASIKATRGIAAAPATAGAPAAAPAGAPAPAPKPNVKTEAEARKGRQPDMSKVPPSLATAPLAQEAGVTGDRFANIDAMGMRAQERAVAAMNEADLAEYLAR